MPHLRERALCIGQSILGPAVKHAKPVMIRVEPRKDRCVRNRSYSRLGDSYFPS
jgi:hypothetical protein